MGLLRKKKDPLAAQARLIEKEIAAVKSRIQKLSAEVKDPQPQLHVRSTVLPSRVASRPPAAASQRDPIFEELEPSHPHPSPETESTPAHYNDWGLRKFDLFSAWKRVTRIFRSQPPSNPQLINLLASGTLHGARPTRREQRIARNQFFFLVGVFVLVLWGVVYLFLKNH